MAGMWVIPLGFSRRAADYADMGAQLEDWAQAERNGFDQKPEMGQKSCSIVCSRRAEHRTSGAGANCGQRVKRGEE